MTVTNPVYRRFIRYCSHDKLRVFGGMAIAILSIIPDVLTPLLIGWLTSALMEQTPKGNTKAIHIAFFILANMITNSVFKYILSAIETSVTYRVTARYIRDVTIHILKLPDSWFKEQKHGKITSYINRVNYDASSLTQIVIFEQIGQISIIAGSLCLSVWSYGWKGLPLIPTIVMACYLTKRLDDTFSVGALAKKSKKTSWLYGELSDPISCHSVVRDYNAVNHEIGRIINATDHYRDYCISVLLRRSIGVALVSLSNGLLFGGTIVGSVIGVHYGWFSLSDVVYFNSLCLILKGYVMTIGMALRTQREVLIDLGEIEDMMALKPHVCNPTRWYGEYSKSHITFRDVGYVYPQSGQTVLSGITLDVPLGSSLGIVGQSGAGKTTLIKLLQGDISPTFGRIGIGGDFGAHRPFNPLFAHVQQESLLFHRSLIDNIGYPANVIDYSTCVRAAMAAGAHDFISKLPSGYNTLAGDRGVMLSGGQRQRIAIARAFYNDAAILILDEATANLDSESEDIVQMALKSRSPHQTVLVIAHRLKTIRDMDCIIVMKDGQIIDRGKHDHLIETCAYYRTLCEKQNAL